MSQLKFTNIRSNPRIDGKELKKDDDGYYTIILGALNIHNSSGEFYEYTKEVKELFEGSSPLMRRINSGYLKSELGHPKPTPGMTTRDYISRICRLEEKAICGHIKEVTVTESSRTDNGSNVPIMIVTGKVKPMGPYADTLDRDLSNPDSNTAFSIRSLTKNRVAGGITIKTIKTIVTWDFVNEPGISIANKANSIGLESTDVCSIDLDDKDVTDALVDDIGKLANVSNESSSIILNEIKNAIDECRDGQCLMSHWG